MTQIQLRCIIAAIAMLADEVATEIYNAHRDPDDPIRVRGTYKTYAETAEEIVDGVVRHL